MSKLILGALASCAVIMLSSCKQPSGMEAYERVVDLIERGDTPAARAYMEHYSEAVPAASFLDQSDPTFCSKEGYEARLDLNAASDARALVGTASDEPVHRYATQTRVLRNMIEGDDDLASVMCHDDASEAYLSTRARYVAVVRRELALLRQNAAARAGPANVEAAATADLAQADAADTRQLPETCKKARKQVADPTLPQALLKAARWQITWRCQPAGY